MLYRVGGVVGVILFILWLYAVFDSITAPAERVRLLPKALWVLTVLLLSLLGAVLWFAFGKPLPVYAPGGAAGEVSGGLGERIGPVYGPTPTRRSRPTRGIAPDDDVAFLRSLDEQVKRELKPKTDPGEHDKDDDKN